jgi:hypothetical protein
MSAIGPKRTFLAALQMSAFRGKADMCDFQKFFDVISRGISRGIIGRWTKNYVKSNRNALPPKADITRSCLAQCDPLRTRPQSTTSDGRTCGAKQRLAIQASADSGTAPTRKANASERSHYNTTHVSDLPHPRMCNPSDEPTGGMKTSQGHCVQRASGANKLLNVQNFYMEALAGARSVLGPCGNVGANRRHQLTYRMSTATHQGLTRPLA